MGIPLKDEYDYFNADYLGSEYYNYIKQTRIERTDFLSEKSRRFESTPINIIDSTGKLNDFEFTKSKSFEDKLVYVDLWATSCRPCLVEMKYNYRVDSLLHANNIERLYIAFDEDGSKDNWLNRVYQLHLGGRHILAGKEFKQTLFATLNMADSRTGTPRYIIVKNNEILVEHAHRPSDFYKLAGEISKLSK